MKKQLIILITLLNFSYLISNAQVEVKSSVNPTLSAKGIYGQIEKINEIIIPALLDREIKAPLPNAMPKSAEPKNVNIFPIRQSSAETVGDNKIYRLKIIGLKATSIKVVFDQLRLSVNTRLYLYNPDGSIITGPITATENIGKGRTWSSNSFLGNMVILELIIPQSEINNNDLHISNILMGLPNKTTRNPSDSAAFGNFNKSSPCNINVLCSLGNAWVDERKAVCLIETEIGEHCSGALVGNSCSLNTPYVLTAWHCTNGRNPNNWTYFFGWWSGTCTPNTYNQTAYLFNGASLKATYEPTDFSLLQLFQTPSSNLNMTYLGWSRSTNAPSTSVCIHHPEGDQMKISYANNPAVVGNVRLNSGTAWRVLWSQGIVEQGSSGSPLFDQDHKVRGQLFSNTQPIYPPCNTQTGGTNSGRFDISWTGGGTNGSRLSNWLDPNNSNTFSTNTLGVANLISSNPSDYPISGPSQFCTPTANYQIANLPSGATVLWYISQNANFTYSQNNNILTVSRIWDCDIEIDATVTIGNCVSITVPSKLVRIGGAPISVTSTETACNEFQFNVYGQAQGALNNWSSNFGNILYYGTSTTASTYLDYITATTTGNDIAVVYTTNSCSQTQYGYTNYGSQFDRQISGIYEVYSNGDQIIGDVNTTPFDSWYTWYINGQYDSDGQDLSEFSTANGQGRGIVHGENTIRVEVTTCSGDVNSSDVVHFFRMGNYFAKGDPNTLNLKLFPNPAKDFVTLKLNEIKNSKFGTTGIQDIKEIRVFDKFGNLKMTYLYPMNTKIITFYIGVLPTDIYFIEVSDGKNKNRLQLSIQN